MNKVFKIDNEVVARVTKTEDDLIETRIMRDLRGDEAEIIGVWLMRLLKIVKWDKITAGKRVDDDWRLFMWITVNKRSESPS